VPSPWPSYNRIWIGCLAYVLVVAAFFFLNSIQFRILLLPYIQFVLLGAVILSIIPTTRRIGLGMLLCAGVSLLLFLAVCGAFLMTLHV